MNIRPITPADAENVGKNLYSAFCGIADQHNFPHDFPSGDAAMQMAQMCIHNPDTLGIVAETESGEFLGSNFLWRHNPIYGVGPISVVPNAQSKGIGRELMNKVIEAGKEAPGIRLVQDAFNTTSLSLYASVGFEVKEPLVIMQGVPLDKASVSPQTQVRLLAAEDYDACDALCQKIHGFDRGGELKFIAQMLPGVVALREGRIVAYASAPNLWQLNHAVAETTDDMQNLLIGAANLTGQPISILLPTRQAELFRWCLNQKLRVVKPMTLMSMGDYQEPRGCFLPSVLY